MRELRGGHPLVVLKKSIKTDLVDLKLNEDNVAFINAHNFLPVKNAQRQAAGIRGVKGFFLAVLCPAMAGLVYGTLVV